MSLVTIEVEIEHGRVIPREPERFPERGSGLLTILTQSSGERARGSISEFIAEWSGKFRAPEADPADPRLQYLVEKHIK